jgi:asparagine synthase (glutamine-hydrolysing)
LGNFLVIVAPTEAEAESDRLFRAGLERARRLRNLQPSGLVDTDWAKAASFARRNGSGTPIVTDPATNNWLLTVGAWFHDHGYAAGHEAQLLGRITEVGGERAARELEGFFLIVFGDAGARELVVITDLVGSRHCYVRSFGQIKVLSTSSLLSAGLADCRIDSISCREFLRTGIVYENRTFFHEVQKVDGARVLRYGRPDATSVSRYWSMTELDPDKFEGKRAVGELSEKLVGAARKVGGLFARPVCDLTGGYDSRVMVAAFLAGGVKFETTVAGSAESADVVVSKGLAKFTGKPHWHLENDDSFSPGRLKDVLWLTDGGYDLIDYARMSSLHHRLSASFDASINGSFGELARGYWWELLQPRVGKRERIDASKLARRRYLVDPSSAQLFSAGEDEVLLKQFAQIIEDVNSGLAGWPNTAQMDNTYLYLRMRQWQGRIASSTDQIWPCLSPFMLRSVLETMLQVRARMRNHSLLVRMMLAELHPALAAYPLEHGYPAAPMTWRTWPRFLPGLKPLVKKSKVKLENRLFKGKKTGPQGNVGEQVRLRLWRAPEVRELLDPQKMRLNNLIDPKRLADFLEDSRKPGFQFDLQWSRMLSLEMALQEEQR